jgi:hypothetical protein
VITPDVARVDHGLPSTSAALSIFRERVVRRRMARQNFLPARETDVSRYSPRPDPHRRKSPKVMYTIAFFRRFSRSINNGDYGQ